MILQNSQESLITTIRSFNRFYTVMLGFLNQKYLGTKYSVTETRILFEIRSSDKVLAKDLCSKLKLDKSYVSRILAKFEKQKLIIRKTASNDKRQNPIALTKFSLEQVTQLIERTNQDIYRLICNFDEESSKKIADALCFIMDKFKEE